MKRLTNNEFIKRAKEVHGNKYDYSKVKYVNAKTKICIVCKEHGDFWQIPDSHLRGHGCYKCGNDIAIKSNIINKTSNELEFIYKAKLIHGNKYDYSKVKYVNAKTKICIVCKEHGDFWQIPNDHLNGNGCPLCNKKGKGINGKLTLNEFIEKAKLIHGDKYDYSKIEYKDSKTKVCISCPKHGDFWQIPSSHLQGHGCAKCHESNLEKEVEKYFLNKGIRYLSQVKFEWLGRQSLDFYLPDYNIGIECQGIQHFKSMSHFGGENEFNKIVERDKRKYDLCISNGIKLLYYTKLNIINDVNYIPNNFIFNLNDLNL